MVTTRNQETSYRWGDEDEVEETRMKMISFSSNIDDWNGRSEKALCLSLYKGFCKVLEYVKVVLGIERVPPKQKKDTQLKQSKGSCYYCGKNGHKAATCTHRDDEKQSSVRRSVRCWFCQEEGHRMRNCKKLREARK